MRSLVFFLLILVSSSLYAAVVISDKYRDQDSIKNSFEIKGSLTKKEHIILEGLELLLNKNEINEISNIYQKYKSTNKRIKKTVRLGKKRLGLKKESIDAANSYTRHAYTSVNSCLRGLSDCSGETSIINHLDALTTLPLSSTFVSFRGTNLPKFVIENIKNSYLHKNAFILDPAYISSTTSLDIAKKFIAPGDGKALIVFVSKFGFPVSFISEVVAESEIIIPRNSEFDVIFRTDRYLLCENYNENIKSLDNFSLIILKDSYIKDKIQISKEFIKNICF